MPAYWPLVLGVQLIEKSGVVKDVKNVIAMDDMPIIVSDVDIGGIVELGIDVSAIVVGDSSIDIDMGIDIDIWSGQLVFIVSLTGCAR